MYGYKSIIVFFSWQARNLVLMSCSEPNRDSTQKIRIGSVCAVGVVYNDDPAGAY